MASISRIARCGSRIFSAGSRTSATGRGKTLVFCCLEMFLRSAASPGRGYSTAGSATLRRAGVSVGALLAGSVVAYGGSLLFRREGSPSIVPAIQADTHAHQPSVSEACTHYHLHTSSTLYSVPFYSPLLLTIMVTFSFEVTTERCCIILILTPVSFLPPLYTPLCSLPPSVWPSLQVCAENKTHSLYLWIHLKPEANIKLCAKVAASIQVHTQCTCLSMSLG